VPVSFADMRSRTSVAAKRRIPLVRNLMPEGKEENIMKYLKPELIPMASAITEVQSSTLKHRHIVLDSMNVLATTAAYEADE
jgi:hypothetical protein